jgi:aldehyde:ferredoxin oxidoreductase
MLGGADNQILHVNLTTTADKLPKRVMGAFEKGPLAGVELNEETFAWTKGCYYEMTGWHPETAVPQPECLEQLGLVDLPTATE